VKISLRKANALQILINEQINAPIVGTATINKFDEPLAVVTEAGDLLITSITQKFDLINVLYYIRKEVAKAGNDAGVAALLTEQALLSKKEAFLKQLASTTQFAPTKEAIDAQLAEIKAPKTDRYSPTSFTVGLLKKEVVESFKKNLVTIRKEKQKINDKLLHLNVTTEIDLPESVENILKQYEII
jgi:hypothetical protein